MSATGREPQSNSLMPGLAVLVQPVTVLRGVGPKVAEQLKRLRISRVVDLLLHLPLRYQDRTRVVPIAGGLPGLECVIEGTVEGAQIRYGRRRSLVAVIRDGSGVMTLRWFYFSRRLPDQLKNGTRIRCFGMIRGGRERNEMVHPEFALLSEAGVDANEALETGLTPVYPTTEGLQQTRLRQLVDRALDAVEKAAGVSEPLTHYTGPDGLPSWLDAVRFVHHPPPDVAPNALVERSHPAQKRLAFDELLAQRLSVALTRNRQSEGESPVLKAEPARRERLGEALGFTLTRAQQRVLAEIDSDLARTTPMLRLLQGDVGSGKTAVAAMAALPALDAGHQVAVMAPTELLARQLVANFTRWMRVLDYDVVGLSGQQGAAERRAALERMRAPEPCLVAGTHALFQAGVEFASLGLVIIDEQHRFGVNQRLALRDKGGAARVPHQLIMTATPIPRTLAMSLYADLDVSTIDELPPSRQPVRTSVISNERRAEVVDRVAAALDAGRQVYWVCPLIDQSETLSAQAASDTWQELEAALTAHRVGLVHGRMRDEEKAQVMQAFRDGEVRLLVATTVIEVGVDVPNATLMIMENAERLGLSQLHQLRGRVGRGRAQSDCVLLYQAPLSGMARERLAALRETNDGFRIAERDLELRGPGELLGVRQAGVAELRIADLVRDSDLHERVAETADRLLSEQSATADAHMQLWLGNVLRYREA